MANRWQYFSMTMTITGGAAILCIIWTSVILWGSYLGLYRLLKPYSNTCTQWRIQGGGSRGSGPPPFGPRCRLFNIGPKVGPPPFVNVQEWGVFQIFWGRMTSRGQCPRGGVLVKNLVSVPGPPPFKNPGSAPACTALIRWYHNPGADPGFFAGGGGGGAMTAVYSGRLWRQRCIARYR